MMTRLGALVVVAGVLFLCGGATAPRPRRRRALPSRRARSERLAARGAAMLTAQPAAAARRVAAPAPLRHLTYT